MVLHMRPCVRAGIWPHLGRLNEQQKSLIEERLKGASARLAKQGLVPGYRKAEYAAVSR